MNLRTAIEHRFNVYTINNDMTYISQMQDGKWVEMLIADDYWEDVYLEDRLKLIKIQADGNSTVYEYIEIYKELIDDIVDQVHEITGNTEWELLRPDLKEYLSEDIW